MRRTALMAAEACGLAAFVYGVWMLAPWAGWIVGGLVLVLAAVALEGDGRSDK